MSGERRRIRPFADAYKVWRAQGWPGTLPLPVAKKDPPPEGFTGWDGRFPGEDDLARWERQVAAGNLCIRVHKGMAGLDVDAWKPAGLASFEALNAKCGPLPATWTSTSRTDGVSGIRLYRIPLDAVLKGGPAPGIEVCQFHHRYVIVSPSVHNETAATYRLYGPDGDLVDIPPRPEDCPEMPHAWLEELRERPREPGERKERTHLREDMARPVRDTLAEAIVDMADQGGRHDAARDAVLALVRYRQLGYPGADDALDTLRSVFANAVADRSSDKEIDKEWARFVDGAEAKVRSTPSTAPDWDELEAQREDRERRKAERANPFEGIFADDAGGGSNGRNGDAPPGDNASDEGSDSEPNPLRVRLIGAGAWLAAEPDHVPAVWGDGDEVLWAEGEPFLIGGQQGLGKTTLGQRLVVTAVGLGDGQLLGYPVKRFRRVLYLAMDRPRQAARSMRRMVSPAMYAALDERVLIWRGPPLRDLGKRPGHLLELALAADAELVVIDSLKDAAMKLTDDEVGANVNRAFQFVVAAGIEVGGLHHERKADGASTSRKAGIDNFYGSTWLTSGCGSVVQLIGNPGDPIVRFHHVKQPVVEVGPFDVLHDHAAGTVTVADRERSPVDIVNRSPRGITARMAAQGLAGTIEVSRTDVAKVRSKLDRAAGKGLIRSEHRGDEVLYLPGLIGAVA